MIYVIRAVDTPFVKIGVANNPISRLKNLQTGMPTELVLLASAMWPDDNERRLHMVLRQYRRRGEWFELPDQILVSLVKAMHSGDINLKAWVLTLPSPPRLAAVLRMAR